MYAAPRSAGWDPPQTPRLRGERQRGLPLWTPILACGRDGGWQFARKIVCIHWLIFCFENQIHTVERQHIQTKSS